MTRTLFLADPYSWNTRYSTAMANDTHCVIWLELNPQGLYAGQPDRLQRSTPNFPMTLLHILFNSTLHALRAVSGATLTIHISCHFLISSVLIPISQPCPLVLSNFLQLANNKVTHRILTIGSANMHEHLGTPQDRSVHCSSTSQANCQTKTATWCGNGFTVLHGILCHFYQNISASIAPSYVVILQAPPTMTKSIIQHQCSYELSLIAYQAAHYDWIHQISLYPESHNRAMSFEFQLKDLDSVLPEFKPYLITFQNQPIRFSHRTKYMHPEPVILNDHDAIELNAILLAVAQSLDQHAGIILGLPSKAASDQHIAAIDSALFANLRVDETIVLQDFLSVLPTLKHPKRTNLSPTSKGINSRIIFLDVLNFYLHHDQLAHAPGHILPLYDLCVVDHILLENVTISLVSQTVDNQ